MQLKMKTLAIAIAVTLAAPLAFAQAKAEKPAAKPAASSGASSGLSVNGVLIPKAFVDAMNAERAASGQPASPEVDKAIKDELVTREVLAQAARKKGIDKDATVAAQMEMARQAILIRAFFDDHMKANPVSDADLKKQYDDAKLAAGDREYRAHHILVNTEDEAKALIAAIKRGENFEKLAKEKSIDPGAKENGGDLDWAPAGRYVPEFAGALKALPKGQITEAPVRTQFGYHVIRVDDSRELKFPAFEEVKENLRQRANQAAVGALVGALKSKAKIEEK